MNEQPSSFYAQLDPNSEFMLEYPSVDDVDFTKLQFNGVGEQADWEVVEESVALVDLGGGLFRLAEKMDGPFSALPMSWGDEFYALVSGPGRLRFQRMDSPPKFSHLRLLLSGPFEPEGKASELIHRHGGGWEVVAGGMLTATVPAEKEKALVQDLREANVFPVGLARTP
jgi:hypothetical protein